MPPRAKSIDNLAEIKALPGVFILAAEGDAKRGFAEYEHRGERVYRRWGVMRDNITPVAHEMRAAVEFAQKNAQTWAQAVGSVDDRVRDEELRNTIANVRTAQMAAEKAAKPKRKRRAA